MSKPQEDTAIEKGAYVLATKYTDGDPGDNWAVGFYDKACHFGNEFRADVRHMVVDLDGAQLRESGFRKVGLITPEYGAWLLSMAKALESAPPGAVDLWGMMGKWATPKIKGEQE